MIRLNIITKIIIIEGIQILMQIIGWAIRCQLGVGSFRLSYNNKYCGLTSVVALDFGQRRRS